MSNNTKQYSLYFYNAFTKEEVRYENLSNNKQNILDNNTRYVKADATLWSGDLFYIKSNLDSSDDYYHDSNMNEITKEEYLNKVSRFRLKELMGENKNV